MPEYGCFLSCGELGPADLVEQARTAEQAGFTALWISDHYHPWNDAQGRSPFVWSVIGALSQAVSLPGEMGQVLPTPSHFEQLEPLITEETVAGNTVCGDDVDAHVTALKAFADAGFDRIHVNQIGPDQRGFFDFCRTKVLLQLP
ncbi:LLM class flavin-dependent oxidoreductase [Streptomyces sp. NPDC088766]|uniref:LLM class flavin-dependent oxidoreductase n=1 Tax=Streptomyces sp. NPDC088766 TaxID=3365893 RepID=UPI0037FB2150